MNILNPFCTDPFRIVFRFCGLAAAYYGAFIWIFNSFHGNTAFALYSDVPPYMFGLPLVLGGLTQLIGCYFYNKIAAILGCGLSATVFLAAFVSCVQSQPHGTGVPAYSIITGIYAVLIHCTIRLPLPCTQG